MSSLFFLNGTNHKISILQQKQDSDSILRTTNTLKCRMYPTYLA